MNRKQFILSQGATCANWNWSWSFINEKKRLIIFGAWADLINGEEAIILNEEWMYRKGKKNNGYNQSREHIRLVQQEGYELQVFVMYPSDEKSEVDPDGPAKIAGFDTKLSKKLARKEGQYWIAYSNNNSAIIAEEIDIDANCYEGAKQTITVNQYERSPEARAKCIAHYGAVCQVCEFDFEKVYGKLGKDYIHVHHIVPLYEIKKKYKVYPIVDLRPVCPNCHAMIHRGWVTRTIEEMKSQMKKRIVFVNK